MKKRYYASSIVSISVISNGKPRRVSFIPLTGGGSELYTDNETLQQALEAHPKYKRIFSCVEVIEDKIEEPKVEEPTEEPVKIVPVTDLGAAKNYLHLNYDEVLSKLKNTAQVKACAKRHNIEFEGI